MFPLDVFITLQMACMNKWKWNWFLLKIAVLRCNVLRAASSHSAVLVFQPGEKLPVMWCSCDLTGTSVATNLKNSRFFLECQSSGHANTVCPRVLEHSRRFGKHCCLGFRQRKETKRAVPARLRPPSLRAPPSPCRCPNGDSNFLIFHLLLIAALGECCLLR